MLPCLLPCYSLDYLGRQQRKHFFFVYVFSLSAQVFPVSQIASTTSLRFLALLRLSSALPNPVPRILSLGSGPQHDAMVSLGRRVLRLCLLVTCSRHPPSRVFRSGLSLLFTLISILVPIFSPVPAPIPTLVLIPVLIFPPAPAPVPGALFSLWYHIDGPAPGLARKAASYLQGPYLVYRDDAACGMAVPGVLLCFFPDVVVTRALLFPPSLSVLVPFSVADPVPATAPVSAPLPSPFPSCVHAPVSNPVPAPSPPPFPSCVRSLASTPVPVPAPSPSPFSSPFPPPTRIPLLTRLCIY